jgi:hypothetical protein
VKPGDLVRVDMFDGTTSCVLAAMPDPYSKGNVLTGRVQPGAVGLLVAIAFIENNDVETDWKLGGTHLEVLVLFGELLGWASALCFSVVS